MHRALEWLRNVRLLSALPDEQLERISQGIRERRLTAGEWIFRQGEEGDRLFIVGSGWVEVVDEGPPEAVIRVLRRGDALGELALLGAGQRSASARAARDTTLLELPREAFERLIREEPEFALSLTRSIGSQLAASRAPLTESSPPRTIAVVGLDRGARELHADRLLVDALKPFGRLARLDGGSLSTLEQAEQDAERVILDAAAGPTDPWSALCLSEADLILAVASAAPDGEWLQQADVLRGCELVLVGARVLPGLYERLRPREVYVIRPAGLPATFGQIARRISGRAPGIVLSGGGARALAHLGVLDELTAAGIHFDRVAGVSLGSVVAASLAADFSADAVRQGLARGFVETNPSGDYVPPLYSLTRGARVRRLLVDAFGDRLIEELPRRFFCLSCDLAAREVVVHRQGRLVDALYPSLAIPGVFPPVSTADGRLLVDGGVMDNLPVARMAQRPEGPVVAVDVSARTGLFHRPTRGQLELAERRLRRVLTGSDRDLPRLAETIIAAITVGSSDTALQAHLNADLVITPAVDGVGVTEWNALSRVRELGREAAREALASHPEFVAAAT
jgi:predicted acylesterase/phospholipase RssA/CRP-like cAMP-binding protein